MRMHQGSDGFKGIRKSGCGEVRLAAASMGSDSLRARLVIAAACSENDWTRESDISVFGFEQNP